MPVTGANKALCRRFRRVNSADTIGNPTKDQKQKISDYKNECQQSDMPLSRVLPESWKTTSGKVKLFVISVAIV